MLAADDGQEVFANADLSETVHAALKTVAIKDWRAYGIANFELARFHHGLDLPDKDTPLMRIFIPAAEVQILRQ